MKQSADVEVYVCPYTITVVQCNVFNCRTPIKFPFSARSNYI